MAPPAASRATQEAARGEADPRWRAGPVSFATGPDERWIRGGFVLLLALVAGWALIFLRGRPEPGRLARPRLVVAIVVDQLRADYLDRQAAGFLPPGTGGGDAGGFAYLR